MSLLVVSSEGVILVSKTLLNTTELSHAQLSSLGKYLVLSMSIWSNSRSQQHSLFLDSLQVWCFTQTINERQFLCCLYQPCSSSNFLNRTVEGDCRTENIAFMILAKTSSFLRNACSIGLSHSLELVSSTLKSSLDHGTFSDSVGGVDHIEETLDSSDEFQEMKYLIENSLTASYLWNPIPGILRELSSMRSLEINVFYATKMEGEVEIELFRDRNTMSLYFKNTSFSKSPIPNPDANIWCQILPNSCHCWSIICINKNDIALTCLTSNNVLATSLASQVWLEMNECISNSESVDRINSCIQSIEAYLSK